MNLVDSSGWLEFIADNKNAAKFLKPLEDSSNLIIPTIVICEVSKVLFREKSEQEVLIALAYIHQGKIVNLSPVIAVNASKLSLNHRIPMADSIILATAQAYNAIIWTQDEHFARIKNVKYFSV